MSARHTEHNFPADELVKTATKCKFCQCRLIIYIHKEYEGLGDPFNLMKYAACNACADNKEVLTEAGDRLWRVVDHWALAKPSVRHEIATKVKEGITKWFRIYAEALARANGCSKMLFDPGEVAYIMNKPEGFGRWLAAYDRQCKDDALAEKHAARFNLP